MDTESQEPITGGSSVGLSVSAAARRLGIAPSTLRSWQRRYGIGPQHHLTGRRRHYLPEDVARLELMHTALTRGASPAEAARWALRAGVADTIRPGDELSPAARPPGRAAPADRWDQRFGPGPRSGIAGHGSGCDLCRAGRVDLVRRCGGDLGRGGPSGVGRGGRAVGGNR